MTAEEKVKRVYPDAQCVLAANGTYVVWAFISGECTWLGEAENVADAWADAWERIQKAGSVRNG